MVEVTLRPILSLLAIHVMMNLARIVQAFNLSSKLFGGWNWLIEHARRHVENAGAVLVRTVMSTIFTSEELSLANEIHFILVFFV